ncbi:MAG: hypothetical protein WC552_06615 [Candidatus Omnitrophota bacterium]
MKLKGQGAGQQSASDTAGEKCVNCPDRRRCQDSRISWIFFVIGLVATVAIRVVTVLMHIHPLYGKISWYVGVGGFFVFFVYQFKIYQQMADRIDRSRLEEKINSNQELMPDDRLLVAAIICRLKSKKERINFFFIFAVSAVALLVAVYYDFIQR